MLDSGLYRGAVKGYRDAAEIEGKAFSLLTDCPAVIPATVAAFRQARASAVRSPPSHWQAMLFAGRPTKMARHAVVNGLRYPSV